MIEPEISQQEINRFLSSQAEWLLHYKLGKSFALSRAEIEIEILNNRLLFSFLDERGFQTWRVKSYRIENARLFLDLTRNFEKESETVILVPRISVRDLSETVELARLEKAHKIAALVKENVRQIKCIGIRLNKENGRLANIIFENPNGEQTSVLTDVSDALTPETLLSASILLLTRLQTRKKKPIDKIWIVAGTKQSKNLQKLHALIREEWKSKIKIFEIAGELNKTEGGASLNELSSMQIRDLWRGKAREIKLPENRLISQTAREILKLAPGEIDVVFSKNGETLRFLGLPFARVRKIFETETVWFGVGRSNRLLKENCLDDLLETIENLQTFRRSDSPNRRHELYRMAPEAWLEAILRRNIKLLDANLILSPIYHQFRAEGERVDLLAVRKDGRLVVIELKTEPDREMIFQAVDYWRKIEFQRRKGHLKKIKLFGDAEIKDKPAICYLVAPTLSFHRDFKFLAETVAGEIEIHRFNLAENWRENLKVLSRETLRPV